MKPEMKRCNSLYPARGDEEPAIYCTLCDKHPGDHEAHVANVSYSWSPRMQRWAKGNCEECGNEMEISRAYEVDTTKAYTCNDCKVYARAYADGERNAQSKLEEYKAELERLKSLVNTPLTDDFLRAVQLEAAHQIERWGVKHDAGKNPEDWYWLLGYLSGKVLRALSAGDENKALHHVISSGAVLLNWFRALTGETKDMRPGIAPPAGEPAELYIRPEDEEAARALLNLPTYGQEEETKPTAG